jgi:hypothetical protein
MNPKFFRQKTTVKTDLIVSFLVLIVLLSACKKREVETIKPIPIVVKPIINSNFLPYFNNFLDEANKRGITFTNEDKNITIQFSYYPRSLGGFIGYSTSETRTIDIDSTWLKFPEPYKELIIFHELGHLLLNRQHTSNKLPNGEYKSIMWSTLNNQDKCTEPLFTGNLRRTYYLNELFIPSTPTPTWSIDNIKWQEPFQTSQNTVINANSWRKDANTETFFTSSGVPISYSILSTGMSLLIGQKLTQNGIMIPISVFFPIVNETSLQNYEVRMRYKLYGTGFSFSWKPNNHLENRYLFNSMGCNETNLLGVSDNRGGFFHNKNISQKLFGWNEIVLQHKDNYIKIWQNEQLLFQSDVYPSSTDSPLSLNFYFEASQYDFEFLTITKL